MITTDLNRAEFDGNGSSKAFVFASSGTDVPIRDESHIKVYVGAVLQTITTHYTVSFVGTTATVTFGTAPASGTKNILFIREVPFTQDTDLVNNSLLEAESLERQLDLVVNQTQQLNERIDKNFRLSDTLPDSDATSTHATLNLSATSRANKAVKFDASGNIGVSTLDIDSLQTQVTAAESAATIATTKAGLCEDHEEACEALLDNFDDRYLGVKGSDPTLDNDSQALVDGALYYSSADDVIKVYDSSLTPKWRQITTTISNQTNIDILTTKYDGSTTSGSGNNLNIAQVNTVALNVANVNNFADLYQISDFDPAPSKDGGGVDALVAGDLAFDTDAKALRVYNGTAWSSGVNTTEGIVVKTEYTANGSTQHYAISHDQGMELIFLNGVKLLAGDGSTDNDYISVSGGSSTTYVGDNNAATHVYFHTAPTNTHKISVIAYGASSNTLAVPPSGGTFTGSVAFNAGLTGTTGAFTGAVSGTTGTFSSTVTGVAGTFSGAVSGTTGTFSGAVTIEGLTLGKGANAQSGNVGFGTSILEDVTTGTNNTIIGNLAGREITDGDSNVALGNSALLATTSGIHNVAIGSLACSTLSGAGSSYNVGIGKDALKTATGQSNVGIGKQAGNGITSGSYNIMIGMDADVGTPTGDYQLNIGSTIYGTLNTGQVSLGTATPNAKAILDLTSTTLGFLPPRMTESQRNAISSPPDGLIVFTTDVSDGQLYIYTNTCWEQIAHHCP